MQLDNKSDLNSFRRFSKSTPMDYLFNRRNSNSDALLKQTALIGVPITNNNIINNNSNSYSSMTSMESAFNKENDNANKIDIHNNNNSSSSNLNGSPISQCIRPEAWLTTQPNCNDNTAVFYNNVHDGQSSPDLLFNYDNDNS
eukprot:Pgem_evm1s17336